MLSKNGREWKKGTRNDFLLTAKQMESLRAGMNLKPLPEAIVRGKLRDTRSRQAERQRAAALHERKLILKRFNDEKRRATRRAINALIQLWQLTIILGKDWVRDVFTAGIPQRVPATSWFEKLLAEVTARIGIEEQNVQRGGMGQLVVEDLCGAIQQGLVLHDPGDLRMPRRVVKVELLGAPFKFRGPVDSVRQFWDPEDPGVPRPDARPMGKAPSRTAPAGRSPPSGASPPSGQAPP